MMVAMRAMIWKMTAASLVSFAGGFLPTYLAMRAAALNEYSASLYISFRMNMVTTLARWITYSGSLRFII